jgi:hypothetical protein
LLLDFDLPTHQDCGSEGTGRQVERLGNILYRILRTVAVLTALTGAYYAFGAPEDKLVVFMLFAIPAILCLLIARAFRFVLAGR